MPANKMPEMPSAYLPKGYPFMTDSASQNLYAEADVIADRRACYLAGIADAREKFASEWPNGEFRLWDSQWVNCVNHDHAYENSDKEDAVAQAVKLAEKYMGKNVEIALTNLTALEQEAKKCTS